jgi:hypothetical protein
VRPPPRVEFITTCGLIARVPPGLPGDGMLVHGVMQRNAAAPAATPPPTNHAPLGGSAAPLRFDPADTSQTYAN